MKLIKKLKESYKNLKEISSLIENSKKEITNLLEEIPTNYYLHLFSNRKIINGNQYHEKHKIASINPPKKGDIIERTYSMKKKKDTAGYGFAAKFKVTNIFREINLGNMERYYKCEVPEKTINSLEEISVTAKEIIPEESKDLYFPDRY